MAIPSCFTLGDVDSKLVAMSNKAKFGILAIILGGYVWYLGTMNTIVSNQLLQLRNVYGNIDKIAAQTVK